MAHEDASHRLAFARWNRPCWASGVVRRLESSFQVEGRRCVILWHDLQTQPRRHPGRDQGEDPRAWR